MHTTGNGCKPEMVDEMIRDLGPLGFLISIPLRSVEEDFNIRAACNLHDICYNHIPSGHVTQLECDGQIRENVRNLCEAKWGKGSGPTGFPRGCEIIAKIIYGLMRIDGHNHIPATNVSCT